MRADRLERSEYVSPENLDLVRAAITAILSLPPHERIAIGIAVYALELFDSVDAGAQLTRPHVSEALV
jgi:hypothetical protein